MAWGTKITTQQVSELHGQCHDTGKIDAFYDGEVIYRLCVCRRPNGPPVLPSEPPPDADVVREHFANIVQRVNVAIVAAERANHRDNQAQSAYAGTVAKTKKPSMGASAGKIGLTWGSGSGYEVGKI